MTHYQKVAVFAETKVLDEIKADAISHAKDLAKTMWVHEPGLLEAAKTKIPADYFKTYGHLWNNVVDNIDKKLAGTVSEKAKLVDEILKEARLAYDAVIDAKVAAQASTSAAKKAAQAVANGPGATSKTAGARRRRGDPEAPRKAKGVGGTRGHDQRKVPSQPDPYREGRLVVDESALPSERSPVPTTFSRGRGSQNFPDESIAVRNKAKEAWTNASQETRTLFWDEVRKHGEYVYGNTGGFANATEEADRIVATLFSAWNGSSNAGKLTSHFVQEAAEREFRLGAVTQHWRGNTARRLAIQVFDSNPELENVFRTMLRDIYDETQKMFKRHGITELPLFRGMSGRGRRMPSFDQWAKVSSQPLTSWSAAPGTSGSFGRHMFYSMVDVKKILGVSNWGGFGVTGESEFILLGFKSKDGFHFDRDRFNGVRSRILQHILDVIRTRGRARGR